jgi:hypothetical protein
MHYRAPARGSLLLAILLALFLAAASAGAQSQSSAPPPFFSNLWVPGLGAEALFCPASGQTYWGGSLRFDILYQLDRNRASASIAERGRSEVYAQVSLLGGDPSAASSSAWIFLYQAGFTMALEGPAILKRDWLIPYIGLEMGGICAAGRGNGLTAEPLAGLALVSRPKLSVSLECGLFLSTLDLAGLLGPRPRLMVSFIF